MEQGRCESSNPRSKAVTPVCPETRWLGPLKMTSCLKQTQVRAKFSPPLSHSPTERASPANVAHVCRFSPAVSSLGIKAKPTFWPNPPVSIFGVPAGEGWGPGTRARERRAAAQRVSQKESKTCPNNTWVIEIGAEHKKRQKHPNSV